MLVAPPPPAAVGAYGIATAGMTPSVLGPAGLLILIGTTLTNSACENTSRPGARGKDLACYTMAFCATTATIAAMATPDMPQTFNDREGAHYGAQPHKYKMEEPPPSTRPLPPWEAPGGWNSIWGFPRDNLGFPDQIAPIGGTRWSIAHRRIPATFRDGYGFRRRQ